MPQCFTTIHRRDVTGCTALVHHAIIADECPGVCWIRPHFSKIPQERLEPLTLDIFQNGYVPRL